MPYLIKKIGDPRDLSTEALEINKQTYTIGRLKECDCVLDHPGVSRLHATVRLEGGKAFLNDKTSRNGTYLNHDRLFGEQELLDGDLIQICDYHIFFRDALPPGSSCPEADAKKPGDAAVVPSTVDYQKRTRREDE